MEWGWGGERGGREPLGQPRDEGLTLSNYLVAQAAQFHADQKAAPGLRWAWPAPGIFQLFSSVNLL